MVKTEEYKQCEEIINNAEKHSKLYYAEAVKFITAYKEGYKAALSINSC